MSAGRESIRRRRTGLVLGALVAIGTLACATTAEQRSQSALTRAEKLREEQRLPEAANAYAEAWRHAPDNLVALRGMVELHHRVGRLDVLEPKLRDAVRLNPNDPFAREALGLLLFARGAGHGDEAITHLAEATRLAPDVADLHYRLGVALVESDRYAEALEPAKKAVTLDPNRARYRLPYAAALARAGHTNAAVTELGTVLSLHPTAAEVAMAERTAKALLDPFRGFPEAAKQEFEIAFSWLQGDAPGQALKAFESLLERYPDLAIVQAMIGLCAAKMDDAGRAIASYRRASEVSPSLAEPHLFLADVYYGRGRPDTAVGHYEAAVASNPFLADAYYRLAESLRKTDRQPEAMRHYTTYTLLRPNDYDAALARATLLTDMRHADAGDAWDALHDRFPRRSEVLVGRGRYYYVRAVEGSDPEDRRLSQRKSRESLEAALELDSENSTATNILKELRALPR